MCLDKGSAVLLNGGWLWASAGLLSPGLEAPPLPLGLPLWACAEWPLLIPHAAEGLGTLALESVLGDLGDKGSGFQQLLRVVLRAVFGRGHARSTGSSAPMPAISWVLQANNSIRDCSPNSSSVRLTMPDSSASIVWLSSLNCFSSAWCREAGPSKALLTIDTRSSEWPLCGISVAVTFPGLADAGDTSGGRASHQAVVLACDADRSLTWLRRKVRSSWSWLTTSLVYMTRGLVSVFLIFATHSANSSKEQSPLLSGSKTLKQHSKKAMSMSIDWK
mmetsp:Transcript_88463/g.245676  ORF Transcript_88463/g.245676 Transcript_88463/m.245676 type:complete len:276 (+) Transcript_88463:147-974(+)